MKTNNCFKCGYPLDSVDHLMSCNVPNKIWSSKRDSKAGEFD